MCSPSREGASVQCGQASATETTTVFEFTMRMAFVKGQKIFVKYRKAGQIEFLYTKETTKEKDGFISGVFQLYIDQQVVLEDTNLNDNSDQWKYFKATVEPGIKEIAFVYQKYNSIENKNMQLEIKVLSVSLRLQSIRVEGT